MSFAVLILCFLQLGMCDDTFFYNNVTGESRSTRPMEMGFWSAATRRSYWLVDGNATWTPPRAWAWRAHTLPDGRVYFSNQVDGAKSWKRPACLGWSKRSRTRYLWFNLASGAMQPERPLALGVQEGDGPPYFAAPGGSTTWEPPPHAAWMKHTPEDGGTPPYYSNTVTGEVAWAAPPEAGVHWVKWYEESTS